MFSTIRRFIHNIKNNMQQPIVTAPPKRPVHALSFSEYEVSCLCGYHRYGDEDENIKWGMHHLVWRQIIDAKESFE